MSRPSAALCLETAVEVAAEAAVHALGGGGAGIGAFLLAGRAPILRDGLSDELHLAVLDALPLLAQELRRSGHPIRIPAERVPDEHATLRSALGTGPAPGLAAFPLFGDVELVACLVAPLPDWRRPRRGRASWRVGARAVEALQAAALSVALDGAGLDPRWLVCEPLDGLVVLDRRGRVVLARGLLERVLGARSRPVIGLKVADVPGADLLAALPPSTGEPRWGAHVLPVEGGEEIPVALAAWTLGPRPPGTTSGRRRTSASGCVVLARERTGSAPVHPMPPGLATAAHLARLQGLLERTLAGAPEHPAAARKQRRRGSTGRPRAASTLPVRPSTPSCEPRSTTPCGRSRPSGSASSSSWSATGPWSAGMRWPSTRSRACSSTRPAPRSGRGEDR